MCLEKNVQIDQETFIFIIVFFSKLVFATVFSNHSFYKLLIPQLYAMQLKYLN